MPLIVSVTNNPAQVNPFDWTHVYAETLRLVSQNLPAGVMTYHGKVVWKDREGDEDPELILGHPLDGKTPVATFSVLSGDNP
ncbi:hypothetical protein phiCbK_133 [Caulobacter phage phiCbK]|uniref:Uncharacterized protein n=5 Tax=Viruses TaxID=10239 RepID=J3U9I7_9CAUD|nr:hypothetical protein D865_gp229 [Caulobacter phage phiCbK]AFO71648.1 hypothetical protein phiCbK_133 [Caulobacter phage phiCbK]AFU87021.1 hypothetical protein CbK_gp189 [Caulobacter phage phiCbK]ARB15102.1 hypothetical protein Ccr32_gp184 [Caulobacter phage Ccr32]ARB15436.1 hypothetical protein Ccr34_gp194 [Caulobacter phage Ccr34]